MEQRKPIPDEVERIAKAALDAAFAVHKALGPGLLESVYGICLCHRLGLLLNFNVPLLKDGIKRLVL